MNKIIKDKVVLVVEVMLTALILFQLLRWLDTKQSKAQELISPIPTQPA